MTQRRLFALAVAPLVLLLVTLCAFADNPPSKTAPPTTNEKLTPDGRIGIIRGLGSELGYARRPFPLGRNGVTLKNGTIADENKLTMAVASYGPALKPGDQARITQIIFKQRAIIFEINGGPERKKKWYEHIEIDAMGGAYSPGQNQQPTENTNLHGSFVALSFDNYVPNLNSDQVKKMLEPVLDFHSKSAAEAFIDTVPPKVRAALKSHQILVGMDQDMVLIAKGRPQQKIREKDPISGNEYEEWIYGMPPQEVQFVRFNGDEVVRLEVMQVNGQKVIKTEKEVDAKKPTVNVAQQGTQPQVVPVNRPSLRRPGEEAPGGDSDPPLNPRTSPSPQQLPSSTSPGGPNDPTRPSPPIDPSGPPPSVGAPGSPRDPNRPIPPVTGQQVPGQPQQSPLPVPQPTRTQVPDSNGPDPSSQGPN